MRRRVIGPEESLGALREGRAYHSTLYSQVQCSAVQSRGGPTVAWRSILSFIQEKKRTGIPGKIRRIYKLIANYITTSLRYVSHLLELIGGFLKDLNSASTWDIEITDFRISQNVSFEA